jgi:uncharacterized tellurite resistance protein B-like protein
MLENLRKLLLGEAAELGRHDDRAIAAAALLISAAAEDGSYDPVERDTILGLLEKSFALTAKDAAELMEIAETQAERAVGLHRFVTILNRELAPADKLKLIEMLWEVVYADSRLDDYEANLMRRLAGLLGVSDFETGEARKRVLARRAGPQSERYPPKA